MRRSKYILISSIAIVIILASVLMITAGIQSQNNLMNTEPDPITSLDEARSVVEMVGMDLESDVREIHAASVYQEIQKESTLKIQAFGYELTLDLTELTYSDVYNEAKLPSDLHLYQGVFKDDVNSIVSLIIDSSRIGGEIEFLGHDNLSHKILISHISEYSNPKVNRFSDIHVFTHIYSDKEYLSAQANKASEECNFCPQQSTKESKQSTGIVKNKVVSVNTDSHYAKMKIYGDKHYYNYYGMDTFYIYNTFNTVAAWWARTEEDRPNLNLQVRSVIIWTSASTCQDCYDATTLYDMADAFWEWGIHPSRQILGEWIPAPIPSGGFWDGGTDIAHLITGKNLPGAGYGFRLTAGVYYSSNKKFAVSEIYPGLYVDIGRWAMSHEIGHTFSARHEDGPDGYKAYMWCDHFWIWCQAWRQTNMWSEYILFQSWGGRFSREGINGASWKHNNAYHIHEWRDDYLRS